MTNLRRSPCRFAQRVKGIYGVGDNIHRTAGSRYNRLHAVGIIAFLFICGCNLGEKRTTCLDLDAACASAVAQNLSHITHSQVRCQYVQDGKPVESSQYLECGDPRRTYAGVTLVKVGQNGAWGSEIQRLPGKVYRITFLSGCVKGGMC